MNNEQCEAVFVDLVKIFFRLSSSLAPKALNESALARHYYHFSPFTFHFSLEIKRIKVK